MSHKSRCDFLDLTVSEEQLTALTDSMDHTDQLHNLALFGPFVNNQVLLSPLFRVEILPQFVLDHTWPDVPSLESFPYYQVFWSTQFNVYTKAEDTSAVYPPCKHLGQPYIL